MSVTERRLLGRFSSQPAHAVLALLRERCAGWRPDWSRHRLTEMQFEPAASSPSDQLPEFPRCVLWELPLAADDVPGIGGQLPELVDEGDLIDIALVESAVILGGGAGGAPGLLRTSFLGRAAGLDRDEFARRYRAHAPLVMSSGPLFHAYVTNEVLASTGSWDGCSQQWYADGSVAAEHVRSTRDHKPAIVDDIAGFIGRIHLFDVPHSEWMPVAGVSA